MWIINSGDYIIDSQAYGSTFYRRDMESSSLPKNTLRDGKMIDLIMVDRENGFKLNQLPNYVKCMALKFDGFSC